jgi:hypothetical protein
MLKPQEIEKIEEIGTLDGAPVKMIKTIGGFWVAAGRPKGKNQDEALAAGSHPAIVKYNVEKQYALRFTPMLAKSEALPEPVVKRQMLKGNAETFTMHTVRHADRVEAVIEKLESGKSKTVLTQVALVKAEALEIQPDVKIGDVALASSLKNVGANLVSAFASEAVDMKKEYVQNADKKISAEALLKRK